METWRYLEEDAVPASFGLAADEFLLGLAAESGTAALRLYTYRPHAALVGQFQNVEAELRLDECRRLNAEINRRLTGGGAIVMGNGQLGLALTLPPGGTLNPGSLFARYAAPVISGLRSLGIDAAFRPKNDVEVDGRKIAGLGNYADEAGALLFHASILVDLDVRLMLRLLNLTAEKISDKHIASFEERLTTVRRACGRPVSVEEVRRAVRAAFEREMRVSLEPRGLSDGETAAVREIERRRYLNPEWVFLRTPPADTTGTSVLKTEAGLLRVYAALAGSVIKSVLITGDFFAGGRGLHDLEAQLKWTSAAAAAVTSAIDEAWAAAEAPVWGLAPAALKSAVLEAIADAQRRQAPQREAGLVQP